MTENGLYVIYALWPEFSKCIEEQFSDLPPKLTHGITCENVGPFYGLTR